MTCISCGQARPPDEMIGFIGRSTQRRDAVKTVENIDIRFCYPPTGWAEMTADNADAKAMCIYCYRGFQYKAPKDPCDSPDQWWVETHIKVDP